MATAPAERRPLHPPLWPKALEDPDRAAEYLQVGFELFNGATASDADAEVFALISNVLSPFEARAAIGDIGLLRAAVEGLATSDSRKAMLLHHLWRPRRFRATLGRFGVETRAQLPVPKGVEIGLRSAAEIAERLAAAQISDPDALSTRSRRMMLKRSS